MKKERLYYLDLIRLIALVTVFVCHFTRSLEANQVGFSVKLLPDNILNVYLGSFGVSLFFIISGAALMYVYDEKLEWKTYYKKRFLGIYPMFWIAFLIAFGISFFRNMQIIPGIPRWKIIYSILGIDGNLLWWGGNYYQLGEWFLSVIICLYIIFPLLRKMMEKSLVITCGLWGIVYLVCAFGFHTTLPVECFFLSRIPEFLFGMVFIKYIKKVNTLHFIGAGIALVGIGLIPANIVAGSSAWKMIATTIVGIGSFSVFTWIFQHIRIPEFFKKLAGMCGKYCYPFFLTHHYLLRWMTERFQGKTLRISEEILLFLCCLAVVLLATRLLYELHGAIMNLFKTSCVKQVEE